MESEGGKAKRFPARVRSVSLFRRIAMMALLAGVLTAFVSCQDLNWPISTWTNETSLPVYVTNNNSGMTVLRPQEEHSFPGGFYGRGDKEAPASYTIRAYEFLPGKGDIPGWFEKPGSPPVHGGQGDLIFYKTYPREEIETMNFTVTITRNVFPGQSPPASLP